MSPSSNIPNVKNPITSSSLPTLQEAIIPQEAPASITVIADVPASTAISIDIPAPVNIDAALLEKTVLMSPGEAFDTPTQSPIMNSTLISPTQVASVDGLPSLNRNQGILQPMKKQSYPLALSLLGEAPAADDEGEEILFATALGDTVAVTVSSESQATNEGIAQLFKDGDEMDVAGGCNGVNISESPNYSNSELGKDNMDKVGLSEAMPSAGSEVVGVVQSTTGTDDLSTQPKHVLDFLASAPKETLGPAKMSKNASFQVPDIAMHDSRMNSDPVGDASIVGLKIASPTGTFSESSLTGVDFRYHGRLGPGSLFSSSSKEQPVNPVVNISGSPTLPILSVNLVEGVVPRTVAPSQTWSELAARIAQATSSLKVAVDAQSVGKRLRRML
ncbi:hypothetical protein BC829DRAFT_116200 [Chytridium lagenaria]|nr:hypothetical protein BC829DRAFT_116200 [Chytridium lagenaria]